MKSAILKVSTHGEGFYQFTQEFNKQLNEQLLLSEIKDGMAHLFCRHTSCAITINESYDPSARIDLEQFMKHLAPRDLGFITHTHEGADDSPSHMKAHLTGNQLSIPVQEARPLLGTWQGLYLCEFRDAPKTREVILKFQPDPF